MAPAPTDEIDTSTPSTAPTAVVRTAVARLHSARAARILLEDLPPKDQGGCGEEQRAAQHAGQYLPRRDTVDIEAGQRDEGECRQRHAAGREPPDDAPIDRVAQAVDQAAAGLGCCRVEDRCRPRSPDGSRTGERAAASSAIRRRPRSFRPARRRRNPRGNGTGAAEPRSPPESIGRSHKCEWLRRSTLRKNGSRQDPDAIKGSRQANYLEREAP